MEVYRVSFIIIEKMFKTRRCSQKFFECYQYFSFYDKYDINTTL